MSQSVSDHHEEIASLKASIAQLRGAGPGGRRQFPEHIKTRVLALRRAGLSVSRLAAELGLAGSQVYEWAKAQRGYAPPQVLEVKAPVHTPELSTVAAQGPLQLRLGAFCITVAVATEGA